MFELKFVSSAEKFSSNLSSQIRKYYWSTVDSKQKILWMKALLCLWTQRNKMKEPIVEHETPPHVKNRWERIYAKQSCFVCVREEREQMTKISSTFSWMNLLIQTQLIRGFMTSLDFGTRYSNFMKKTVACIDGLGCYRQRASEHQLLSVLVIIFKYFIIGEIFYYAF